MRYAKVAGLLLVIVAVVVWKTWPISSGQQSDMTATSTGVTSGNTVDVRRDGVTHPAAGDDFSAYLAASEQLGELPGSLAGTAVDGELSVDAAGNLIIDNALRRVFDYFIATLGEEDLESIKARIALHLHQNLPPGAAEQAWAVLMRYLEYGEALAELPPHDGTVESMHEVLVVRRDMRQAWLGQEVADAFFAMDDAFDAYSLARVAVQQDSGLSAEEKQARQRELETMLPEPMRAARERMRAPVEVSQQVDALRAEGASETAVRALREQHFGREATERLEQLDRERVAWDNRYDAWRTERAAIEASGLAADDQARELEAARARHFDEQEQRRVQALDRIHGEG